MNGPRGVTLPRVFGALLGLFIVLEFAFHADVWADLVFIVLAVIGTILAYRMARKSIWSLRNRLYVTWFFIGVVPILLILALAASGTWIVCGQVAAHLVDSELDRRAAFMATPALILSQASAADRALVAEQMGRLLAERMPGVQVVVTGAETLHYPPENGLEAPIGGWKTDVGCLLRNGRYYSAAIVNTNGTTVAALAPITPEVLGNIVPGIGTSGIGRRGPIGGLAPEPAEGWGILDFQIYWPSRDAISVVRWENPAITQKENLVVSTRPSAVLRTVFGTAGLDYAQTVTLGFVLLLIALLGVQLISWVIGMSLSRTISSAAQAIYEGTQRIAQGDFSWRIPVKGNDQLAEVGNSFNNMTAQIENLVVIAKEKERLQSEVEIAGEVQNQLFPRTPPSMRTIELVGVCEAARMVSGDYYDYLSLPDGNLALAIGDVAGKGISAALLMASIQSIMRTQLAAGLARSAVAGSGQTAVRFSTSGIVAQLNR
jgi:sigma-B regulation protein RsbU (phosphoserine phosphatase)